MKEVLSLQCPYKVILDLQRNSYHFNTQSGAIYEVYFALENSIFDCTYLQDREIYNVQLNKVLSGSGGADKNIAVTIDSIVNHFFIDPDRLLIYSCDGIDSRELTRLRMFNSWYNLSPNKNDITKLDGEITGKDRDYYSSLIYHNGTRLDKDKIAEAYTDVIMALRDSDKNS